MRIDNFEINNLNIASSVNASPSIEGLVIGKDVIQAIAGEDLSAGDLAGLAAKKAYKYHEWRNKPLTVSGALFNPGGTPVVANVFPVNDDPSKFMTLYLRSTVLYGVISQMSGDIITAGTPTTLITSASTTGQYIKVVQNLPNPNRYFVVYKNNVSGSDNSIVVMFDISGLSISLVGSQTSMGKTGVYQCQLDTNKYLMSTKQSFFSSFGYVLTWNPGSNTWSVGADGGVVGDDPDNGEWIAVQHSTDLAYTASDLGTLRRVTVSGTTVSAINSSVGYFDVSSSYVTQAFPSFIKDGNDLYVRFVNFSEPNSYDFLSRNYSYRKIISGTVTVAEIYSGEVATGGVNNPYASLSYATNQGFRGEQSRQIVYDTSNPWSPHVDFNIDSVLADYWYCTIVTDPFVQRLGITLTATASTSNVLAGLVIGQNRDRFVLVYYDGSIYRYTIIKLFKPSEFKGIVNSDVASGDIANIIVRGLYTLPQAEPENEGKFLQIFNGRIYPSDVSFSSIGIHTGDSYAIGLINSSLNSEKSSYYRLPLQSQSIAANTATAIFPEFADTVVEFTAVSGSAGLQLIADDGSGNIQFFTTYEQSLRPEMKFYVPHMPYAIRIVNFDNTTNYYSFKYHK